MYFFVFSTFCFEQFWVWRKFLKGAWLNNGLRAPNNFGLKSCARLESKRSASGAIRKFCAAEWSRNSSRGGHYGPPPGKQARFGLNNFGVDEIFLKGRGFGTVCPGVTNLVSKVARDLKVKSQRAARSKNFARRNGRGIRRGGGPLWPPPG